jgi:hypothetical protein
VRITFDTNTIDHAVRPQLAPKDSQQPGYFKIHEALKARKIEGFFCETLVTLEGIQKVDRAEVLGSMRLQQRRESGDVDAASRTVRTNLTFMVEQPKRKPLNPAQSARIQAALDIGMRVLSAPRIGGIRIDDPANTVYVRDPDEIALTARLNRYTDATTDIESRDVGASQALALAKRFAERDGAMAKVGFGAFSERATFTNRGPSSDPLRNGPMVTAFGIFWSANPCTVGKSVHGRR